jgi:hypothetical protein
MLRAGCSLAEIGQVLRHEQLRTTTIYAKVDYAALRTLALPGVGLDLDRQVLSEPTLDLEQPADQ